MSEAHIVGGSPFLLLFLIFIEIGLLITMTALWFRGMQKAMEACHPVSRSAEPESVWLTFIPLFGLVWQFVCVVRISDSIAREYHRRGWHSDEDRPGRELGIVAGVVICIAVLLRVFFPGMHPGFGFLLTLAMCLCMFLHTSRLNSFRERMEKELDPTTAFGQIPVAHHVIAPAFQTQQTSSVNQQVLAEQLKSAYTHIPFVPPTPFVPEQNNTPPPQKNPANDFSKYMPPAANPQNPENLSSEQTENTSESNENKIDRWAPPKP
jgi:hypothetical protein